MFCSGCFGQNSGSFICTAENLGATVAQSPGHQPGNREVPGLVLGFDSWLGPFYCCCFLRQETLPQLPKPYIAVNRDTLCVMFRAQLKNNAAFPVKITEEKKSCTGAGCGANGFSAGESVGRGSMPQK